MFSRKLTLKIFASFLVGYRISTGSEGGSWLSNQVKCKAEGGDLVVFETESEWKSVVQDLQSRTNSYNNEWYIGLRKFNDRWTWVNGLKPTFDAWLPGEPSGDGNFTNIYREHPSGVKGRLNDQNGNIGFICEYLP